MKIANGLVPFLLASALAVPASLAQDASGAAVGGSSPSCSLLAGLEPNDARVFMQGYLVGRRDRFGSGSAQGAVTDDNTAAGAGAAQIKAGPSGAASPVGGGAEPAQSPNLEAQAEGNAENAGEAGGAAGTAGASQAAGGQASAFSLASLNAMVDAAVANCQASPDRPLLDIAGEADPRDPMNREPGLAGEGAPRPD